jgi:uracil-DNA glycosylase
MNSEAKRELLHAIRLCRRCPSARQRLAGYYGGEPHAGEGCWNAAVVFLGLCPSPGFQRRLLAAGRGADYLEARLRVGGWSYGPRYFPFLVRHFAQPILARVQPELGLPEPLQQLFFWTDLSRCPLPQAASARDVHIAECRACREHLVRTLELLEPRLVVLVGRETWKRAHRHRLLGLRELLRADGLVRGELTVGKLAVPCIGVPQPGYLSRFVASEKRPGLLEAMGSTFGRWLDELHGDGGLTKPGLKGPSCRLHRGCPRRAVCPVPAESPQVVRC